MCPHSHLDEVRRGSCRVTVSQNEVRRDGDIGSRPRTMCEGTQHNVASYNDARRDATCQGQGEGEQPHRVAFPSPRTMRGGMATSCHVQDEANGKGTATLVTSQGEARGTTRKRGGEWALRRVPEQLGGGAEMDDTVTTCRKKRSQR